MAEKGEAKAKKSALNLIVFLNDSDYLYGKKSKDGSITEVHTSVLGLPSGEGGPLLLDLDQGYCPAKWGRGFMGPAESSFPSPKEWHFCHSAKDLDKVDVKHLTRLFSLQTQKPPTCIAKWEAKYGPMKWGPLQKAYCLERFPHPEGLPPSLLPYNTPPEVLLSSESSREGHEVQNVHILH